MTNIDRKTLDQARDWAKRMQEAWGADLETAPGVPAAVEVIQSLPDEIIDGATVREIIEEMAESLAALSVDDFAEGHDHATERWRSALEALLPAPAPRTLADMTPDERQACQWMQATYLDSHHDQPGDHAITNTGGNSARLIHGNFARLIRRCDGLSFEVKDLSTIVPHPDLPKLEWPGSAEGQA